MRVGMLAVVLPCGHLLHCAGLALLWFSSVDQGLIPLVAVAHAGDQAGCDLKCATAVNGPMRTAS